MALVAAVSTVALTATIWIAFRELGWQPMARAGATLLLTGLVFWTEPVQRALFLGQVELVLMALVVWDLCQPDRRWWKGAATGLAAAIKLVPLLFIVYLVLTRRFRQAAVAVAVFAVTVIIGFAVLPGPSKYWWIDGNFFQAGRTGFVGDQQNQSLRGMLTRLVGSVNGSFALWLVVAIVVGLLGLAAAVVLYNSGRSFAGLMACALTALLISPISWDHHWVWIAPGLAVIIDAAVRARTTVARVAWWALAAAVLAAYGAWPDFWSRKAGPAAGRADQLRPGQLLRARRQPGLRRIPLARPAAPRREPLPARRPGALRRHPGDRDPVGGFPKKHPGCRVRGAIDRGVLVVVRSMRVGAIRQEGVQR